MQWDDYWVVINPYTDKGFSFQNLLAVCSGFYHSQYAPLNEIYYITINSLFGYDPFYFHIGSLILHLSNTVLVYFLILTICSSALRQDKHSSTLTAFFTTLIFALHPLNLEAVAWIGASKVLIYALFYLIAIHLYIKYLNHSNYTYFFLSVLFFVLSFAGKEQAITFPFCLLLLDYVFNRNFKAKRVWIEKIVFIVLAVFFGLITMESQGIENIEGFDYYSYFEKLVLSFYTLSEYITKCLVPIKLSYIYPFPFRPGEPMPLWLFIYPLLLLAIGFGTIRTVLSSKWLLFGTCFFLIHIAIALHLVSLARHSVIADRYAYLSTIGVGFIICYFLLVVKRTVKNSKLIYICLSVYILCMAIHTKEHLQVWENSKSLKKEVRELIRSRKDFERMKQKYKEQ